MRPLVISLILLGGLFIGLGGYFFLGGYLNPQADGDGSSTELSTEVVRSDAEHEVISPGDIDSTELVARQRTPRSVSETEDGDPFIASADFNDFMARLEELEPETRGVDAYQRSRWLESCRKVVSFGRLQPGSREQLGLHAEASAGLQQFCRNALPDSIDLSDSIDSHALSAWTDELFFESSAAFTEEHLETLVADHGHDAAVEAALKMLANSLDEGVLLAALDLVVRQRIVAAPFDSVEASYLMYDPELMMTVAGALVCDRLGGCGPSHPLTLRHCLQSRFGCYQPLNYVHAVEQTIPPVEFQAFTRLHQEAVRHSNPYRSRSRP